MSKCNRPRPPLPDFSFLLSPPSDFTNREHQDRYHATEKLTPPPEKLDDHFYFNNHYEDDDTMTANSSSFNTLLVTLEPRDLHSMDATSLNRRHYDDDDGSSESSRDSDSSHSSREVRRKGGTVIAPLHNNCRGNNSAYKEGKEGGGKGDGDSLLQVRVRISLFSLMRVSKDCL